MHTLHSTLRRCGGHAIAAAAPSPAVRERGSSQGNLGWWRSAVTYQVYVRSFQDSDGYGVGDLGGLPQRLPHLRGLGVDAIWLNPFYPSPQHDHGYDVADYLDVDPAYGTLDGFDALVRDAHRLDIKVVIDVVPNHCSIEHAWFTAALAGGPGSAERHRFHFADGRGPHGELPPNNWRSLFGGPAWRRVTEPDGTPGQWYLHTFAPEQADFNWRDADVAAHFEQVLRFWFDRGVDGLRIDVAHGLHKHEELPGEEGDHRASAPGDPNNPHAWNQPEVHDVWRSWRALADEFHGVHRMRARPHRRGGRPGHGGARGIPAPGRAAPELLLRVPARTLGRRRAARCDRARLDDRCGVGLPRRGGAQQPRHASSGDPVCRGAPGGPVGDIDLGLARARAAALLMLALPGSAFIYQGDELGLPEVTDLPQEVLTDPMFHRTAGARRGRDGCRVPLPWDSGSHALGFSPEQATATTWLPQPYWFGYHAVDRQLESGESTLHLYRAAIALRHRLPGLATGDFGWLPAAPGVLAFTRGDDFACVVNCSSRPVCMPVDGHVLHASHGEVGEKLPPNSAAWLLVGAA